MAVSGTQTNASGYTSSPALYEAGSALLVSAFQISLAAGAAMGGALMDQEGMATTFVVSAAFVFWGAAIALLARRTPANASATTLRAEKQV